MTMQLFVCGYCTMIAAPVQCDVDGIPEASHLRTSSDPDELEFELLSPAPRPLVLNVESCVLRDQDTLTSHLYRKASTALHGASQPPKFCGKLPT